VRSTSARLSTLALVAVVAPVTVVVVLGYVSLRQWEASSDLLLREQARDTASMAAEKIEIMLRHAEDAFLDRLQGLVSADGQLDPALDRLVAQSPLVGRLYLFDRGGERLFPPEWRGGDAALFAPLARGFAQKPDRAGKREIVAGGQVCLARLVRAGGEPVLAAFSRDLDALRREIFDVTLGGLESPTAVLDARGRPVYSRAPAGDGSLVAAVSFREGLPEWRLAVYATPGTSPRHAVRRQVMLFTLAFGVLLVVIVAGILATWRLTRRETEMARLKSDFVANVSHDLKTPLSVIRMFGETLEMGRVPDESRRREYYRVITRESERLSRLIDNVLDFSRIEGGRQTYDRRPTAVEPLIRDTLEAFAYPLEHQGFKINVTIAPDLPEVEVDTDAVGQALANLIDNAIKYSAEERALTVDARVVDGRLAVSVEDQGVGISPAEHEKIFEKFYRVGQSDTQGRRGSGVGLALVRHIVEAHGGDVTVESAPGAGSRFTLRLPLGRGRDA
jgi:signal transduction histidine kinase